ncbi:pyridoxamine 5'-phosphate oxidase family protein [Streptomyces sp. KS 21]|uniref:helix-turn-helix domain-containing protein n=1 Tax=Streptomyces sp. KS 21 TaxID=2485150 RepID=UPI0010EB1937|nr:helix-turn-helix protein [Streptomyces sp. KS 21]
MNTPSTHSQQPDAMTGRTDLGRRLAARREALGLSRDELGRRCGADGTYITYLEEHAASPAIGTLVRVADALGLPVNYLVAGPGIAFRTSAEAVTARAAGTEVAFEIDNIDDVTATGWSVLAVGELAAFTDPDETHHLNTTARSQPWAGGPRSHWMKLTPTRITGRHVVHDS